MSSKRKSGIMIIFCLIMIILTSAYAWINAPLFYRPLIRFMDGEISFEQFSKTVQENYQGSELRGRLFFININGLYSRVIGRTKYNDVQLMKNGMLTYGAIRKKNMKEMAENMISFNQFVQDRGGQFFFILAPYKVAADEDTMPIGAVNYGNQNADDLLNLIAGKLTSMDFRQQMSRTTREIEQYMYRTDQHWSADGAFYGYQLLMNALCEQDPGIRASFADHDLWERYEKANWWLGSFGKRVGKFFAGTDSLIYYLPRFETQMSLTVQNHSWFFKGNFEETVIRHEYIDVSDYFGKNAYCVYIGGDYPLSMHRNKAAPNHQRILLIKDSFMLPLESFLSTEFREIDVIDPRYYSDSTLAEYVEWTRPDLVILMCNPSSLNDSAYASFGCEAFSKTSLHTETADLGSMKIADESEIEHNTLMKGLRGGETWHLSFQSATAANGKPETVSVAVLNEADHSIVRQITFDVDYCNHSGYDWSFKLPEKEDDEEYRLVLYPGKKDDGSSCAVEYKDITIAQIKY